MSYPVILTKTEFETATNIDLDSEFATADIDAEKFLNDVSYYTFENAIYSAGQKPIVDAIITSYTDTVDQIKNILIKVAEYMLVNEEGGIGLYSGIEKKDDGSYDIGDTQKIIDKILPPNIMTAIMNIRPSLVYTGGYANV